MYKWPDLLDVLCALNPDQSRVTVENRIKSWRLQNDIVPEGDGKGKPLSYSFTQIHRLALVSELNRLGISPKAAIEMTAPYAEGVQGEGRWYHAFQNEVGAIALVDGGRVADAVNAMVREETRPWIRDAVDGQGDLAAA